MSELTRRAPASALAEWVAAVQDNPVTHRQRQVTEIVLNAVGRTPHLRANLILKGGALMAIAFGSPRSTADLDFTAIEFEADYDEKFAATLNPALLSSAADLGYVDLRCQVQTVKKKPKGRFEISPTPGLQITIGSAKRGTSEETALDAGQSSAIIGIDVSFKEAVLHTEQMPIAEAGPSVQVYSLTDLVAEKFRSYLQQVVRKRERRQDIFDLAYLIELAPHELDRAEILTSLIEKCRSRNLEPSLNSIDDPELMRRAKANWDSQQMEIDGALPTFEECFAKAADFYRSLPW